MFRLVPLSFRLQSVINRFNLKHRNSKTGLFSICLWFLLFKVNTSFHFVIVWNFLVISHRNKNVAAHFSCCSDSWIQGCNSLRAFEWMCPNCFCAVFLGQWRSLLLKPPKHNLKNNQKICCQLTAALTLHVGLFLPDTKWFYSLIRKWHTHSQCVKQMGQLERFIVSVSAGSWRRRGRKLWAPDRKWLWWSTAPNTQPWWTHTLTPWTDVVSTQRHTHTNTQKQCVV